MVTYEEFKNYCFTHSWTSETETTMLMLTFNYEKGRHLLVWNQIIREVFSYDETNIIKKIKFMLSTIDNLENYPKISCQLNILEYQNLKSEENETSKKFLNDYVTKDGFVTDVVMFQLIAKVICSEAMWIFIITNTLICVYSDFKNMLDFAFSCTQYFVFLDDQLYSSIKIGKYKTIAIFDYSSYPDSVGMCDTKEIVEVLSYWGRVIEEYPIEVIKNLPLGKSLAELGV